MLASEKVKPLSRPFDVTANKAADQKHVKIHVDNCRPVKHRCNIAPIPPCAQNPPLQSLNSPVRDELDYRHVKSHSTPICCTILRISGTVAMIHSIPPIHHGCDSPPLSSNVALAEAKTRRPLCQRVIQPVICCRIERRRSGLRKPRYF